MPSSSEMPETDGLISLNELSLFHIFRDLGDEKLAKVREIIEVKKWAADEVVIQDGEQGDTLYLLLDGEVAVTKALVLRMSRQEVDQTDKSFLILSSAPHPTFGKPIFGEMALFSESSKRTATVKTTCASTLGVIYREPFFNLCESDMEIGYRISNTIAVMLSERLDKANQDVLNLTTALSFVLASH